MAEINLAERLCFGLAGFLELSFSLNLRESLSELALHAEAFKLLQAADTQREVAVNVKPRRWEDCPGRETVDLAVPQQREWKAFIEMKYLRSKTDAESLRLIVVQDLARLAACTDAAEGRSERLLVVCFTSTAWRAFPPISNTGIRRIINRLLVNDQGACTGGTMSYQELQRESKSWQARTPHGVKVPQWSGVRTRLVAERRFAEPTQGREGLIVAWKVTRV